MEYPEANGRVLAAARKVELLLMDCDGVLTDGSLYFSSSGEELKAFHVHDGQGVANWHAAGFRSGVITGRNSEILARRAAELGIEIVRQGVTDKFSEFESIIGGLGFSPDQVAYIGDDVQDIGLMKKIGFPVAVADSLAEVLACSIYATRKNGGRGAVRETVDLLLCAKGMVNG